MPPTPAPRPSPSRLAVLALAWMLLAKNLGPVGLWVLPRSLLSHLDLASWSMLVQLGTTAIGVALAFALLEKPLATLGLVPPSGAAAGATVLLAPALYVVFSWTALQIALPWLLDEIAHGHAHASRENAGAFGQTVTHAPLLVTLVWGALLAAFSEELAFRGALWTAVRELVVAIAPKGRRVDDDGNSLPPPDERCGELFGGIAATVVAGAVFGAMHADMQGSVGIVRVVATTCLGLASGTTRLLTGSIAASMLLHFTYNALSIGVGRKWFEDGSEPLVGVLPNRLLVVAAVGIVGAVVVLVARRLGSRAPRVSIDPLEP
jgi:membrane protease YdiL (CAAX protease family)